MYMYLQFVYIGVLKNWWLVFTLFKISENVSDAKIYKCIVLSRPHLEHGVGFIKQSYM
jgi:hypothetical protein